MLGKFLPNFLNWTFSNYPLSQKCENGEDISEEKVKSMNYFMYLLRD